MRWRISLLIAPSIVAASAAAVALFNSSEGRGAQNESKAKKASPQAAEAPAEQFAPLRPRYFSKNVCSDQGCHAVNNNPDPKKYLLCRGDEVLRWQKDRHQDAYAVLTKSRAVRMGELLGVKNVADDRRCLACHSVDVPDGVEVDEGFRAEGISCAICHGAYANWVLPHGPSFERQIWRDRPPEQKQEKFGMTDLWNQETRARLCASCHIGDYNDGKVVTHEMYVAGHPPLPGIEFAAFANAMPRHWQYLREKSDEVKELLRVRVKADAQFEQTKYVLVGGMVALAQTSRLLADEASAAAEPGAKQTWPELAQFDCYACHHELERPSIRQQHIRAGTPGRPQLHAWPIILAQLGLRQLGSDEHMLHTRLAAVYGACNARPFGQPAALSKAAGQLAGWADEQASGLNRMTIDETVAVKLLHDLASFANRSDLDYDSARQIAWAFQIIFNEWNGTRSAPHQSLTNEDFPSLELQLPLHDRPAEIDVAADLSKRNAFEPRLFNEDIKRSLKRVDAEPAPTRAR